MCGLLHVLTVKPEDFMNWQVGQHAQDAFPYLPAPERELLISATCPSCWTKLFPPEEE